MTACAALDRLEAPEFQPGPAAIPLVLIGGFPRHDLAVERITMIGPLDRRSARLAMQRIAPAYDPAERARVEQLIHQPVTILHPLAVDGGENRLIPSMTGRILRVDLAMTGQGDNWIFSVECDWTQELHRIDAEQSAARWLENLNVETRWLSDQLRIELDQRRIRSAASLADMVKELRLALRREFIWAGNQISERRRLVPSSAGRPIRLGMTSAAQPAGLIERWHAAYQARKPLKLTALGPGQIVESTFPLIGGWDPARQGLAESQYAKSTSDDFDAVANVFRLWVLNEDGAFVGTAFDQTAFFDEGQAIEPAPRRLKPALTQDEAGRSVGIVVEMTLDDGATWTAYPGVARVLNDRAGVYLNDDELPPGFITAILAGEGWIRVTGCLQSPLPMRATIWRGNPLAGPFDSREFQTGDRFAHQRLDAGSRYAAAVAAEERTADTRDDRGRMAAWLADRAGELSFEGGEAELTVTGPRISLQPGDRLARLTGRGIDLDLSDRRGLAPVATLMAIEHNWNEGRSKLTWKLN